MELVTLSFATAFIISAIEGVFFSLNKWRGLVAILLSGAGAYYTISDVPVAVLTALAASFIGMTASVLVESSIDRANVKVVNRMPRRIPPL